jgi:hypothetical protein
LFKSPQPIPRARRITPAARRTSGESLILQRYWHGSAQL